MQVTKSMTNLDTSQPSPNGIDLTIAEGPGRGLITRARAGQILRVGRAQDCDLRVFDPRMSRHHFEAEFSQGRWWICDLTSSNGTRVNDRRISEPTEVCTGDIVSAGDTRFEVNIRDAREYRADGASDSQLQKSIPWRHQSVTKSTVSE